MTQKMQKKLAALIVVLLLLSLIPLYVLGFFAHPSVDDYYYGAETAAVFRETGSLGKTVAKSWELMQDSYQNWQGNFAAIFLMRLEPGIFGEEAYVLAPLILLSFFVAGMLFFFYTALRRLAGANKNAALGIAAAIACCALQFTYKPSDSFYWFNGGIYYTFFFSLSLFLLGLLILAESAGTKGKRLSAACGAALLGLVIGGGNYSTALSLAVLLASLLGWKWIKGRKDTCLPAAAAFVFLMASFILSILAPGNAIRQAVAGEGPGVAKALLYSFAYGGYSLAEGLKLPVVLMWLLLLPLLYRLSARRTGSFSRPLWVLLYTFGIYASQGTALFYAQGMRMPPRMSNIIYFNAYLFIAFNLFYFCGWLRRRHPGNILERVSEGLLSSDRHFCRFALLMALCVSLSCLGLWQVREKEGGGADFQVQPLSVSAAYSLLSGEAGLYDSEMNQRAAYLASLPEGAGAVVSPLSAYPPALTHSEITTDPLDFKNDHLARFYHLGSVVLGEP